MSKRGVVVPCVASHLDRNSSNVRFHAAACTVRVVVRTPSRSNSTASKSRGVTRDDIETLPPVAVRVLGARPTSSTRLRPVAQDPVADVGHVLEVLDDVGVVLGEPLLAPRHEVARPGGVRRALLRASITRWYRDALLRTTMSNGVVVVPSSMKPRTRNLSASGRPWTSWWMAPG